MLHSMKGKTWQELIDQIPAESREWFARTLIGALLRVVKKSRQVKQQNPDRNMMNFKVFSAALNHPAALNIE